MLSRLRCNRLLHRSNTNAMPTPPRAFGVCCLDKHTHTLSAERGFLLFWGKSGLRI